MDEGFERYIRGVLGNEAIDGMRQRSKNEMMRTWEEKVGLTRNLQSALIRVLIPLKVKYKFGNSVTEDLEVNLPGVDNNVAKRIEDGFHIMEELVTILVPRHIRVACKHFDRGSISERRWGPLCFCADGPMS